MRTYVLMREYGYMVTEHDAGRPWIVLDQRHETVQLGAGTNFFQWAAGQSPPARFTVTVDTRGSFQLRKTSGELP